MQLSIWDRERVSQAMPSSHVACAESIFSDLASAVIGPRSNVLSGPEELLECKKEMDDEIEKMMVSAEVGLICPF